MILDMEHVGIIEVEEMYQIIRDPLELTNLTNDPEHHEALSRLLSNSFQSLN